MAQLIGQDFSKQVKLDILPHVSLSQGMFLVRVDWMSRPNDTELNYNSSTWNVRPKTDLEVIVGVDVYSVELWLEHYRLSPTYSTYPTVGYHYQLRIDRLILLNMAIRLLSCKL